jgi:hypothetical protein
MLGALFEKGQTMSNGWPLEVMSTGVVGFVAGWFALVVAVTCLVWVVVCVVAYIVDVLKGEN